MVLLTVSNLTKAFGAETLFSGLSFDISEGDRIGLIGANGSGKTTLFRLLTGELPSEEGEIHYSKITRLGYVQQHVVSNSKKSAYDEVLEVFRPLMEAEEELASLPAAIDSARGDPDKLDSLVRRQHALTEQFEREGGYTYRSQTRSALLGLGFSEEMIRQSVDSLSGGEKAKVLLARMLLSGANLLLLDEPTNHLDIESVEWLEEYLQAYRGALIVVSHDRYFLDRVTTRTFEIENQKLTCYNGGYTVFQQKKEKERETVERHYANTMREIERIEGIVAQQRQWNRERNIRTAESKLKEIDRLRETLVRPDSAPETLRFRFPVVPGGGNEVLRGEDLGKSFGERTLFEHADLLIRRDERVFLLGQNGCGKTTLLKILLGQLPPDHGERVLGSNIFCGYYDQTQAGLHPEKAVIDEIWDAYPSMTQTEVRSALGRFLFRGDDVFKPISALSGGERARVCLLKLMLSQANFLLLDEPTNHLDITSREALESALSDYEGTLLIVSHDRYFINKMATRILGLTENGIFSCPGSYEDYAARLKALDAARPAQAPRQEAPSKAANDYLAEKERKAALRKLRARFSQVEKELAAVEEEIDTVQKALFDPANAADYQKAAELSGQLEALRARSDALSEEWLTLGEQLEG